MAENSPLLPALTSSRLGLGVATVALVALASGTTGVLVAHGTKQLQPRTTTAAPPAQLPGRTPPVLVDRAPGSLIRLPAGVPAPAAVEPVVPVPAVQGPPVALPPLGPPATPPVAEPPVVAPPVVAPPVVAPPVVEPPVVEPPVVEPPSYVPHRRVHGNAGKPHGKPSGPSEPSAGPHSGKAHQDNGKHLGQEKHGR